MYYANFLHSGHENVEDEDKNIEDKAWSFNDELYLHTSKAGSVVRIYSLDGSLFDQRIVIASGQTKMKLPRGKYIVVINNNVGKKVIINN